jgi:hypothetical protein
MADGTERVGIALQHSRNGSGPDDDPEHDAEEQRDELRLAKRFHRVAQQLLRPCEALLVALLK